MVLMLVVVLLVGMVMLMVEVVGMVMLVEVETEMERAPFQCGTLALVFPDSVNTAAGLLG